MSCFEMRWCQRSGRGDMMKVPSPSSYRRVGSSSSASHCSRLSNPRAAQRRSQPSVSAPDRQPARTAARATQRCSLQHSLNDVLYGWNLAHSLGLDDDCV
jgi:hypothetical protein